MLGMSAFGRHVVREEEVIYFYIAIFPLTPDVTYFNIHKTKG